jgi:hypothetical protein
MHDDNNNEELFDGAIELQRHERGRSFGLDPMTYFRLARCCNEARGVGIEPCVISRLPSGQCGCRVVLYGSRYAFTLCLRVFRSYTTIAILAEPLDAHSSHCTPVFEGEDDGDRSWSRALRALLEFENVAYYDSFWAEEQQQGEA